MVIARLVKRRYLFVSGIVLIGVLAVTSLLRQNRAMLGSPIPRVTDPLPAPVPQRHTNGTQTTQDSDDMYSQSFKGAWYDCAQAFVDRTPWFGGFAWCFDTDDRFGDLGAPWLISAPDDVNDARRDGWRACCKEIQKRLLHYPENVIREQAREALKAVESNTELERYW